MTTTEFSFSDRLAGPVDEEISAADAMFERHLPPDLATSHYFYCGRSAVRAIKLALAASGTTAVRRILDLPCGHGRVLRTLKAAFPDAELHACDLDRGGVDFCAARFGAKPIYSDPDPARILLDGPYDAIWVGSLLTHLDAHRWPGFLNLFRSVLSPQGVCAFTTHGRWTEELIRTGLAGYGLKDPAALLKPYRKSGFAYTAYPGQEYGISLSNPAWVMAQLTEIPSARILLYHERGWADHQDVVAWSPKPAG